MPRPRKPLAAARVEGRIEEKKARYAGRNEYEATGPLGEPPAYITDTQDRKARSAWITFAAEIPWLTQRDRTLVEMACLIKGELMAGGMPGIQRLNLLRQILSQMGATPSDATKVSIPAGDDDGDEEEDIFTKPTPSKAGR